MKLYFKEESFRDYSRVGYDSVSIYCSLRPFGTEEGSSFNSCWYFVEIDDRFTREEAIKLGNDAIRKSLREQVSVHYALKELESQR